MILAALDPELVNNIVSVIGGFILAALKLRYPSIPVPHPGPPATPTTPTTPATPTSPYSGPQPPSTPSTPVQPSPASPSPSAPASDPVALLTQVIQQELANAEARLQNYFQRFFPTLPAPTPAPQTPSK